jgi:hypothetical protein
LFLVRLSNQESKHDGLDTGTPNLKTERQIEKVGIEEQDNMEEKQTSSKEEFQNGTLPLLPKAVMGV